MTGPIASSLEGAKNFRDLGGLPVADGRTVRPGVLYRSEALSGLTQQDRAVLDGLAIQVAFDLRTPEEREAAPSRWGDGRVPRVIVAEAQQAAHGSLVEQVQAAITGSPGAVREAMLESYRAMPQAFGSIVRDAAEHVLIGESPVLVSCLAGKDRTGFVSAMLLLAVGAQQETVERDYLRSNFFFGPDRIRDAIVRTFGRPAPDEALQALGVRPEYLRAALEVIDDVYGSLDAYLETQAGLTPARRADLQRALLQPASA